MGLLFTYSCGLELVDVPNCFVVASNFEDFAVPDLIRCQRNYWYREVKKLMQGNLEVAEYL